MLLCCESVSPRSLFGFRLQIPPRSESSRFFGFSKNRFPLPRLVGGVGLNSSISDRARLGSGVAPPLGVVKEEVAVLIALVRRHRRAAVRRAVFPVHVTQRASWGVSVPAAYRPAVRTRAAGVVQCLHIDRPLVWQSQQGPEGPSSTQRSLGVQTKTARHNSWSQRCFAPPGALTRQRLFCASRSTSHDQTAVWTSALLLHRIITGCSYLDA